MEDQLISFDTAKLAKEKGLTYDDICQSYRRDGGFTYVRNDDEFYLAPTQSLLQNWLREKHNMFVIVTAEFYSNGINHNVQILTYDKNNTQEDYFDNSKCTGMFGDNGEFDTYELALEFGLVEALKLL